MTSFVDRHRFVLTCLTLVVVTAALYWPVTHHSFINIDDPRFITQNPHTMSGLTWPGVRWAFQTLETENWHPLTWISHMVDCQLYGLNAGGHHFTSLLIHVVNSVLVFVLLQQLTGAWWRSAMVAALFAWHPLHVESVAWVSERKDVLCAFFYLAALLVYARYGKKPAVFPYILTLLLFAAALMSKPMAVTLPLALILLDFWPLQRFQFPPAAGWRRRELMLGVEKIPFGVMALISSLVTVYAQKKGGELIPLSNLPLLSRPANAVLGYVTYLSKTFWPAKLTVFYPYLLGFTVTGVMGAFLLLGGMSVLGILQARQRPWLLFGWFWFLGLLIPVIGLIQVGMQSVADRYMYLPSIGLFVVVVWEVERRCSGLAGGRKVRVVLNAAVLAGCLTMTTRQLGYWQNSITLAQRTLQVTQENYVAYDSLGRAYIELGEPERAVPFCTEAVKLNPDWPQGQFSLGLALSQTGQTNDAIQHFEAGLARTPGFAAGRLRLGQILQQFGRMDEAMAQFAEALRLDPGLLDAQISWGITLAMQKKIPEAIVHFSEAARLEPDNPEIEFDLGLALLDSHQPAAASVRFTKALQFTPSETKVHYRLAQSLQQQNQLAEAALHYREALRLTPDFPEAKAALDAILASNPEFKAGIGR